jgi:hypothetical protein
MLVLLPAGPAAASCASDSGPSGSAVVFVGTSEEHRRGYTRMQVHEVWYGPDLADEVWVLSGQEQAPWPLSLFASVSSSVDADLPAGSTFVVGASDEFRTSACSVWSYDADEPRVARLRPDVTRSPRSGGAEGADPPVDGPVAGGLTALGVGALALGVVALRQRRRQV